MDNIKVSELFCKYITNYQTAAISEDENLLNTIGDITNSNDSDLTKALLITRIYEEFIKVTTGKALALTLSEIGFAQEDIDLLDTNITNKLLLESVEKVSGKA